MFAIAQAMVASVSGSPPSRLAVKPQPKPSPKMKPEAVSFADLVRKDSNGCRADNRTKAEPGPPVLVRMDRRFDLLV